MHLDSVVARHYHLQRTASRAARAALDDSQTSEHRIITIKSPPCYPPLEDVVDLRIPMHFADFDLRNNSQRVSYLDVPQKFHEGVDCLLKTPVTPLDADVHLCSMESFTPDGVMLDQADEQRIQGSRFMAVVGTNEMRTRWVEIHTPLKALARQCFGDWREPPIRYFSRQNVGLTHRL